MIELDIQAYRKSLGRIPTGVVIVTARAPGGAPVGVTCNSFTSVSLEPAIVSWALRPSSRCFTAFLGVEHFAVNVLAADQASICQRFADSTVSDKFEGLRFRPGAAGSPLIDGSLLSLECVCVGRHEIGDHSVFFGEVLRFGTLRDAPPMVFHSGRFGTVAMAA